MAVQNGVGSHNAGFFDRMRPSGLVACKINPFVIDGKVIIEEVEIVNGHWRLIC